jgi:hypothetical protein
VATIVYLDPEDEITSAAMRIRQAPDIRVALVVPFGSRVATSRINFRLLAREAMRDGRRLDIVAPDASARALAASAGIPVFSSVGEYESAIDEAGAAAAAARADGAAATGAVAAGAAAASLADAATVPLDDIPVPAPRPASGSLPAGAVAGFAAGAAAGARLTPTAAQQAELDAVVQRSREAPLVPRASEAPVVRKPRRRVRTGLIAGFVVLAVALGIAGVAGFLFLPAATITVTPLIEPVGPVTLSITADPDALGTDAEALVIPAELVEIPVDATADFPATGKRVEKTPASGAVRWSNCDPTAAYTIPKGTQVRTSGGTAFAIDEAVFLPVAIISGGGTTPDLKCQSSEVAVTAVKSGEGGNVPAGAIKVVPSRYNRTVIRVTNPNATTGGTETSFTRISKKDVESALVTLQAQLEANFQAEIANPERIPPGATAYPETAKLGEGTPTEDVEALVGQEVETFTLGMTATGTMLAVDPSPIEKMAASRLDGLVTDGAQLVEGSTEVTVGEGTVGEDGLVTFEATVTAKQVTPVDPAAVEQVALGKTKAEAEAALAPYGDVTVTLWPAWVTTVPTMEQRVDVIVNDPVDAPAAPADAGASGAPDGESGGEPLPSG